MKGLSKIMLCTVASILLMAFIVTTQVFAFEPTDNERIKDIETRYIVRPVNISSEEYIEISGIGKVYFNVDVNGHYYPTLANADITTTVTKIGHIITNTYYNSTNYVFYSSAIKKWTQTEFNNDGSMTVKVRVEVTIFNEYLGSFTTAHTFNYQV